jgi:hypothetical protein
MIEDMTIRYFATRMQTNYIRTRTVRTFAAFLSQSPDQVEPEDLRRFQLRIAAPGSSPAKTNAGAQVTLNRVGFADRLATTPPPALRLAHLVRVDPEIFAHMRGRLRAALAGEAS